MRVLRDVIVDRTGADEFLAVSHAPGIEGEEMLLDLLGTSDNVRLRVRVIESRPVVVDGAVRHRLRLARVERRADDDAPLASRDTVAAEAN